MFETTPTVSYNKLWERTAEMGITKAALRDEYGFAAATVARLSNNRSVTVTTIIRLCDLLDCQPGDIMERVA